MRPLPIAACLALATATMVAFAQDPATPDTNTEAAVSSAPAEQAPAAGDAERGRALTYTCQGCHGVPGYENAYPTYRVPMIGGQSEVYLVNALTAYRNGERQHPTMQAQAESFSEADIADIAAFLSSLQP
ncbi:MAG TPA: cytochrome c [Xanthomonadaceae bacterium]|nr:cytochrome c [Xanthomonadaceae bacterium]